MNTITYDLGLRLLLTSCFKEVVIPVATDFIYTAKDSIHHQHNINFIHSTTGATYPLNRQLTIVGPHSSTSFTS
ncbi:hypothetical protein L3C95_11135 [Chitinophaga filiformis]|uniref:hypothetical protein n=1 Tax=Chitinophaga filiformis TaxID=104663 RepID=UPI001F1709AE|nr:hypothetical protein [Chitinophaga filiformis]MCF6402649.1 hypothetical protein [Chitinophaga filiformis]MCF6403433.1 hypothetical protein [Chitinophaga filiformis]